ncbi:hypothetical protein ACSBR2_025241 [Camellia fascicularis]
MRTIVRSVRQFQSIFRRRGYTILSGLSRKQNYLASTCSVYRFSYNGEICRYSYPYMILRALFADAAKVANGEVSKAGPLIEYERRIEAGDLVDGDNCQVGTIRELQRLYDELANSAEVCLLDRYAASEKAGMSRWLWSRFIPQSSYSPVKGLYLYGGVGTGKTMLMDLFFDQLPSSWRKRGFIFMISCWMSTAACNTSTAGGSCYGEDITERFHTLALDGVPIFGLHNRTAAYRFVTLVDVMYENKARLMCTAEGTPVELFEKIVTISDAQHKAPRTSSRSRKNDDLDLCVDNELGFPKDRTISRLTEMNSKEYLEQHSAMLN